jgi:hypothetical protein
MLLFEAGRIPHESPGTAEAHSWCPRIGGELGVTLEMLVGFVERVSVDLGASPYIATNRTQSLHAPTVATTIAWLLCANSGSLAETAE